MRRRDRERKTARRKPFRDPRPLILIVSEGKNTEPSYFNGLVKQAQNPRVRIVTEGGAGVPHSVVEEAQRLRDEALQQAKAEKDDNLAYEQVWAVFDRDDFPEESLRKAFGDAKKEEVRIAFSNPNFELWLYLHLRDQPGAQLRHRMAEMLRKEVPSYHPDSKLVEIALFIDGYKEAVKRGRALKKQWDTYDNEKEPWDRNPYTDVHILTELITAPPPEAPEADTEPSA